MIHWDPNQVTLLQMTQYTHTYIMYRRIKVRVKECSAAMSGTQVPGFLTVTHKCVLF